MSDTGVSGEGFVDVTVSDKELLQRMAEENTELKEKYAELNQRYCTLYAQQINNSSMRGYDGLVDRYDKEIAELTEKLAEITLEWENCCERAAHKTEMLEENVELTEAVKELEVEVKTWQEHGLNMSEAHSDAVEKLGVAVEALEDIKKQCWLNGMLINVMGLKADKALQKIKPTEVPK